MKKFMPIGPVSAGKTTLSRRLAGEPLDYKKTQTAEVVGNSLDTPGEYLEYKNYYSALTVMAVDVDVVLMVQSCTDMRNHYPPGICSMFSVPVWGVVTKIDQADSEEQIQFSQNILKQAGASKIFCVSSITEKGIEELKNALEFENDI